MHKGSFAALVAIALAGCTTTGQYGNFVPAGAVDQQKLACEAVQQLATLYPPAKTRFELQQPTPDVFGQSFVKSLRERGYALLEFDPARAKAQVPAETPGLPVRYVLDQGGDSKLYRLTLMVGNQSISRPYLAQGSTLAPAGYWVRKE